MTQTTLLALIGALTGTISLTITWLKHVDEKAEIKVSPSLIEGNLNAYFFPSRWTKDDFPGKPYRMYVQVDIFNNSSLPITVYEVQAKTEGITTTYITEYIHAAEYYQFQISPTNELTIPIGKNQIKLPLEMSPYKMKRGYIFFPVKQEMSNDTYILELTFLSSRGKFTCKPIEVSRLNPEIRLKQITE